MAEVKDAPLTEEELAEIERAALDDQRLGIKGDYSFDVTGDALRLVAEVRRLRAENAEWEQAHRVASESVTFMRNTSQEKAVIVLADVIRTLRLACEEFGDNEWGPDLHPSDIIEKHLLAYVRSE
jgi:hypothetical protein